MTVSRRDSLVLTSLLFPVPRIVGRGGSGLDKLRVSGVEVEVVGKRDSNRKSSPLFSNSAIDH